MLKNTIEYLRSSKENLRTYVDVWDMIDSDSYPRIKAMLIWLFLVILFSTCMPLVIQYTINTLIAKNYVASLYTVAIYFILGLLVVYCNYKRRIHREYILGQNRKSLNWQTAKLFFGFSIGEHLAKGTCSGEAVIKKGKDKIIAIEDTLLFFGLQVVGELVLALLFLMWLNFVAGFIMLLLLFVHGVLSLHINHKIITVADPLEKKWRDLDQYINERLRKPHLVKAHCKEEYEINTINQRYDELWKPDYELWSWVIRANTCRELITNVFWVAVIVLGIYEVSNGSPVGILYPLISWCSRVSQHLWAIADVERMMNSLAPSVRLMLKELHKKPLIMNKPNAVILKNARFDIEFKDVGHTYVDSGGCTHEVLRGINLYILYGTKVALIARSGTGKTTLMQIMKRDMDCSNGSVLFHTNYSSYDVRDVNLASFLQRIGCVSQETELFDGSILYNIRYGCNSKTPSRRELEELARECQVMELGSRFSDGLATLVGENGRQLSGGERQRIAWAVALAKNPDILIFDEATSNIDAQTESDLTRAFDYLVSGRTTFVIAHRLRTIMSCDMFVVLRSLADLGEGESQIETVAYSFTECKKESKIFCALLRDQELV